VDSTLHLHTLYCKRFVRLRVLSKTHNSYEDMVSSALVINNGDPTIFKEAANSQEKSRWVGAMAEEIEYLHKN